MSLYKILVCLLSTCLLNATQTRSGGGTVYSKKQLREMREARERNEQAMRDAAAQKRAQIIATRVAQRTAKATSVYDSDSDSDITCSRKTCCCLWILSHFCR